MTINILTRCTRFNNLLNIKNELFKTEYDVTWHILFDMKKLIEIPIDLLSELYQNNIKLYFIDDSDNDYLYPQCGLISSKFNSGWVYFVDDDNVIHEEFLDVLNGLILINENKKIFIVSQKVDGKDFTKLDVRLSLPENTKYQGVDIAQILFHHTIFKEYNFVGHYSADGFLIEKIYKEKPEYFFWYNEILSYYNYFEPIKKPRVPKVMLINDFDIELKSNKFYDYEDDSLETINIRNDHDIVKNIAKHKPDSIITVSKDYREFKELCNQPLQIRSKWYNLEKIINNIGDIGYNCAMNNILVNDNSTLISYFTPIYNTGDILYRTYQSLKNQTYTNWEWVIVNDSTDNGKTLKIAEEISKNDYRVKLYDFREKTKGNIGESKYRAATLCNGYLLCELDHDDLIVENCTEILFNVSKKYPEIGFFYSDNAEINDYYESLKYGEGFAFGYGKYETVIWNNKEFDSCIAPNINPKTIRHIVGVPNHIRVWRKELYHKINGHNRNLNIADDYELIIRTFLNTKMMRIPKMLYLQFIHSSNSHDLSRKDIQRRVRTIMYHYNDKINERFIELGVDDYCYRKNKYNPLSIQSQFGDEENKVNLIYND